MNKIEPLKTDNVSAIYDSETKIARIIYQGALTPAITASAYGWIFSSAVEIGVENLYGGIFDFREVTSFDLANIRTVKRTQTIHADQVDFSQVPTGLLVKTLYQEQMVRVSMKVTHQTDRLRIVQSEEEALAFIEEWHRNKQKKTE